MELANLCGKEHVARYLRQAVTFLGTITYTISYGMYARAPRYMEPDATCCPRLVNANERLAVQDSHACVALQNSL